MAYVTGDTLARVVFTAASGLPEDQVVNDFVLHSSSDLIMTDAEADNAAIDIDGFYNAVGSASTTLANYLGSQLSRNTNAMRVDFYRIVVGDLGSPFRTVHKTLAGIGGTPKIYPGEVAAVLSFHADTTGIAERSGGTRPASRRRGRVFLGPMNSNASILDTNGEPRPSSTFLSDVAIKASALKSNLNGHGIKWSVWSRSDVAVRPIVGGYIDDAYDTQRRRGHAATSRTTWT